MKKSWIGRTRRLVFVIVPMALAISCAAPYGPITRDDWRNITTREFTGKTPGEVLDAAARVMELADPETVHVSRSNGRMVAQRPYSVNLFLAAASVGCYAFDLRVKGTASGTATELLITRADSCKAAVLGDTARDPGKNAQPIDTPDAYDLFYKRMASILNGKPWITCSDAGYFALFDGPLLPLCLSAQDLCPHPKELGKAQNP